MSSITLTGRDGRKIKVQAGLFINNEFLPSNSGATLDVHSPFSGELLGTLSAAEAPDVDKAVNAAQSVFHEQWKATPGASKGALLNKLADLIERDTDDFAALHAIDGGFVYDVAKALDISIAVSVLRHFAGWADKISGRIADIPNGTGYVRREPIGVCGMITPWNAPLMITCWKLGPAISAGNVVVIKTPELAPLIGQKLAELVIEAGFPPGVINILNGLGGKAGKALAEHMQVGKISFTGSTATGRTVLRAAANSNLKKVTLELGGKGPSIVFDDANLPNAIFWTSLGSTANNGQICVLGSRIYVQNEIYDEFVEQFQAHARSQPVKVGNPLEPGVNKGPIISKPQQRRILSYIEKGKSEGARLLTGGKEPQVNGAENTEHAAGFVENTIFVDVEEHMTIVKEEIFGPVATIHRFQTEKEVIEKANATTYGLASAIFSNNVDRIRRVSSALETGQVTVNCWGTPCVNMPFGGVKESGFGRDMGEESLEGWTNLKAVYHWNLDE